MSQSWTQGDYYISTDPALIWPEELNAAYATDTISWTKPLPIDQLRTQIQNSLNFALYHVPSGVPTNVTPETPRQLIGLARLITDKVSFAYMTDVYIIPFFQKRGLATFLMQAVRETTQKWPHLRSLVLFTPDNDLVEFYKRELGVRLMKETMPYLNICSRNGSGYTLPQIGEDGDGEEKVGKNRV